MSRATIGSTIASAVHTIVARMQAGRSAQRIACA
jgi:hypothetical protein